MPDVFDNDLHNYLTELAEDDHEDIYCPDEMERADLERD